MGQRLPTITTTADALAAGFTLALFAESDFNAMDILVMDDTDLDDAFVAYVPDWNECIRINGWMWTTTADAQDA